MYVHTKYLNNNGTIHLLEWKDNTHAISLFSCYRISKAFYLLKPCITLYFTFSFWQVQWLMELKDIPWSLVKLYILTELSCYSFYNYSLAELQVSFSSWLCHGKFQVSVAVLKLVGTFSSFYLQCCLRVRSTYSYLLSTVQGIEVFDSLEWSKERLCTAGGFVCRARNDQLSLKCLLVKTGILGFGIRNSVRGIRTPANGYNPESADKECGIHCVE